jgi:hypothetical protein
MTESDQGAGTYSQLLAASEKKRQASTAPATTADNTPATSEPVVNGTSPDVKVATDTPAKKASNRDTTVSRHHDTIAPSNQPAPVTDDAYLEDIRKAVKQLGEKAATHRFTADEKNDLGELVFAWKKKGISTSENEITRIAVNYMLYDYHKNKQASIVASVLERLHG